jgi:hypothetical protein
MGITQVMTRVKGVRTVLGVDASTNSFAFCLFGSEGPIRWGEVTFKGSNVFERLSHGQRNVYAMREYLKSDLVVFESAVFVQNKKTVILLAYAFGAVISALMADGTAVEEIAPLTWQNAIGNKALTKHEKQTIIDANPGKSSGWYQNKNREFRKLRTKKWCKDTYGIEVDSDNVSDAIAIASVAYDKFAETDI